ncbi:hypothetical protein Tco_1273637 [Tanacetum coccineum]
MIYTIITSDWLQQSVKKAVGASSGAQNLAFMTAPSTNSFNDVNTAKPAYGVLTRAKFMKIDLEAIYFDVAALKLIECFNCHKMRHFARERKAPRNKDGFDWSDMAEEQVQTNMALMVFFRTLRYTMIKPCTKTCLKNYETLKKQCDDLIVKLNQTEFTAATYKRGLATVEEQLITYRKNEVLFSEEVAVLKREVACKDYEINVLKKSVSKKGFGYNDVPPPHPLIYNRPKKLDLSYSGLDEFKDPEFKSYGSEDSKQESNIVCDKKSDASKENSDDSLVKEQVSEDTSSFVESSLNVDKETIFHEKPAHCKYHQRERMVYGNNYNRVNYNYTTNMTFDVSTAERFTTANVHVTTASASISTASVTPKVSTSTTNLVYIRRSAEKKKDKGKAIMKEDESSSNKVKEATKQEGNWHEEAIRYGKNGVRGGKKAINEEENQRIARDAKIAKQLQEEFNRARQEQEVVAEADQAHDIDWSDPAMLRYHALQNRSFSVAEARKNMCMYLKNQGGYKQSHFKGMSYEDIRPVFEKVWDQVNAFVPKDSELENEVMKRPRINLQQESSKKVEEEIIQQEDVVAEQVMIESSKKAGGRLKRKVSNARKDKNKRQKMQDDPKKLTLKEYVEVISDSEEVISVIPLAVKSPIIMFELDSDDEVWKNHQHQELIEWKLYDSCGVHSLMLGEVSIHMLLEKRYPLLQDTLTRMLQWKLHVNNDATEMAYELLRFIRSQLQK